MELHHTRRSWRQTFYVFICGMTIWFGAILGLVLYG